MFFRERSQKIKKAAKNVVEYRFVCLVYLCLHNNQINARALIGQSAVGYCASKPTEKSRAF